MLFKKKTRNGNGLSQNVSSCMRGLRDDLHLVRPFSNYINVLIPNNQHGL
jgi:hypothetical protein